MKRIQYISQGENPAQHLHYIKALTTAGCPWVQLRLKDVPYSLLLETAKAARQICIENNALFIVNDNVQIALESQADGVHLGKEDMPPSQARKILGKDKIIGGTANTFEDIEALYAQGVDYIGLGPFRFTSTKKKLSPILGVDGYAAIVEKMQEKGIEVPIFAIGGIIASDLTALSQTGIYGIAVSGWWTKAQDKQASIAYCHEVFA